MNKKKNYHIIGYLFLIFSFFCAYLLRNLDSDDGGLLFLLVIAVCVSSDIGGFIFGVIATFSTWKKLGGKKFWSKNHGAPDHKEATYSFTRSSIPKVKR